MRVTISILLLFFAHLTWAQETPVLTKDKFKLFGNKINNKLSKADTIKLPTLQDSLKVGKADSVERKNLLNRFVSKADSLQPDFNKPDTLKRISFEKPTFALDTINKPKLPNAGNLPGDSLQQKAEAVSGKVNEKVATAQNSIKSKTDSLKLPGEVNNLQQKLGDKTNVKLPGDLQLPGGTNIPAGNNPVPGLPTDALNLPGADPSKGIPGMPDVKLPNQNGNQGLPDMKLPDQKGKSGLPNANLPDQNGVIPNAELPNLDATGKVKEKLNLPTADIPELAKPDSAQMNELKEKALEDERLKRYAEPVSEISDRVDPYKKNLDSLSFKDAGEIAATETEAMLGNTKAAGKLNEQMGQAKATMAMPQQAAMLQKYQDKKILKEEMLRKSKNVMNEKITSVTPEVQDQQKTFAKAKKLNSSVPSVKNMNKKRTDELKARPFYERIVPGIGLQTMLGDVFSLDIAPQVSYRINTPWSVGTGLLYRVGFDKKYDYFAQGQGIHGFKTFVNYRLVKGLFLQGEYERIKVSQRFDFLDKIESSAVSSAYLGLGKRYPISRKFYGSLIALYKFELENHLPGSSKFNLRVVIEYKTKKVRKPTDL